MCTEPLPQGCGEITHGRFLDGLGLCPDTWPNLGARSFRPGMEVGGNASTLLRPALNQRRVGGPQC